MAASCRYDLRALETRVAAILSTSGFVESTLDDGAGALGVVLEATPFYAEQGGQVADTGLLTGPSCSFEVQDTKVCVSFCQTPKPQKAQRKRTMFKRCEEEWTVFAKLPYIRLGFAPWP